MKYHLIIACKFCFRQIFATKLEAQVLTEDQLKNLKRFKVETHLRTVESAQAQKNFHLARKYLSISKNEVNIIVS